MQLHWNHRPMWECAQGPTLASTSSLYTFTENKPLKSHFNVSGAEALIPWRQSAFIIFLRYWKDSGTQHVDDWKPLLYEDQTLAAVLGWVIGHPILQNSR